MKYIKLFILGISIFPHVVYSQTIDHWETIVFENAIWKFNAPSSPLPASWNTLAYNDAAWSSGPGGFGYGDGDDNTVIPATLSCFQRIVFNVADTSKMEDMVLNFDYDDACVIYINGVEIARRNITSAGSPAYNQPADGLHEAVMYSGGYPETVTIPKTTWSAWLVQGNNVLCAQVHNDNISSSDMSMRVWLHTAINDNSSTYGIPPSWFNPPLIFTSSNLPIIILNTGGVPVPDEPKISGTMGVIYNGPGNRNYITDTPNEYNGNIGIETRGSSSSSFPKKAYGIETRDPLGNAYDVTMFNMPFDNDWVLYAPYSDKSLIRNVLTYKLARDMGRYAPRTVLCEVVLNGDYIGVYVLMEKIKQKTGRVDIDKLNYYDTLNNELTGGYVLKIDKLTAGGVIAWNSPYPPYTGSSATIGFQMHDPEKDSMHPLQLQYIQNYVTSFENALYGPAFNDPQNGYAPFIDVGSFQDYMIMDEFSKNVDGYRLSSFFYKNRVSEGGKISAGPLWDFNLAWGNANYCNGGQTTGWELDFSNYCPGDGWQNPFWWKRLMQDTVYANQVYCRWQSLRTGKLNTDTVLTYIDSLASYLSESQQRNFQRWPILGTYVWPNNYIGTTHMDEINYVKNWITARGAWIDANLPGNCWNTAVAEENSANNFLHLYPNPFNESVTVEYNGHPLKNAWVLVTDITGKTISTHPWNGGPVQIIETARLAAGLYRFILLDSGKSVLSTQLLSKY